MWKQKVGERHPAIREIDKALSQAMSNEWDGIMVALRWPRYEVVLKHQIIGRGLSVAVDLQAQLDRNPEIAPVKTYRAFSLIYIGQNRLKDYITGRGPNGTETLMLPPLPDSRWDN